MFVPQASFFSQQSSSKQMRFGKEYCMGSRKLEAINRQVL